MERIPPERVRTTLMWWINRDDCVVEMYIKSFTHKKLTAPGECFPCISPNKTRQTHLYTSPIPASLRFHRHRVQELTRRLPRWSRRTPGIVQHVVQFAQTINEDL